MRVNRLHVGHRHAIYITLSLEALGIDGFVTSENKRAIKISEGLLQPNSTLKPPLPSTVSLYRQRHAVNHSQTLNTQIEVRTRQESKYSYKLKVCIFNVTNLIVQLLIHVKYMNEHLSSQQANLTFQW